MQLLKESFRDLLPVILVIMFFQYVIIKKPIDNLKNVLIGFGLVILGLDAFMVGYMLVITLTFIAPKYIISIAYDSGGVTTSTVTVPLVAAIGLGLATNIPGRDPLIAGFGLIAFASLFPMI